MIARFMAAVRSGDVGQVGPFADWLEDHDDPRAAAVREALALPSARAFHKLIRLFPAWRKDAVMGCDIHCYLEYRERRLPADADEYRRRWRDFGRRINPGRNYRIFSCLAGVRGAASEAVVPPRGKPDDMGYAAADDLWHFISDTASAREAEEEGYVTPDKAARWHDRGLAYRERDGKPVFVEDPDWHSHSWLTPDEWEAALKKSRETPKSEPEYYAVLAALRALEAAGYRARVVFWFDN
jgi:hypothetical protein